MFFHQVNVFRKYYISGPCIRGAASELDAPLRRRGGRGRWSVAYNDPTKRALCWQGPEEVRTMPRKKSSKKKEKPVEEPVVPEMDLKAVENKEEDA